MFESLDQLSEFYFVLILDSKKYIKMFNLRKNSKAKP